MKHINNALNLILFVLIASSIILSSCKKDDPEPEPEPETFTLTVNSGTGGGEYEEGTVVNIQADAAPSGQVFVAWTGNTNVIANIDAASTTITMPSSDVSITATYTDQTYALTVENGFGDGEYAEGEEVSIQADAPESGKKFDAWTGEVSSVSDVNASTTTLTMPAQAATVTASFVDVFTLTVNNGSGAGEYEAGEEVTITANDPPSGELFYQWTGSDDISDTNASSTTITMPESEVIVSATYGPTAAIMLSGTWKESKFYEKLGDGDFEEITTNGNYRLTFNFSDIFEEETYSAEMGNLNSLPNFNSKSTSGDFNIDDLGDPAEITFDPGSEESNVMVESASQDMVVLIWTVENDIDDKPAFTYKLELIPE